MIFYFCTDKHTYTITPYLRAWDQAQGPKVQVVPYAALPSNTEFPAGAYLFTDMDRLSPAQRAVSAHLWRQLEAAGDAVRLYNHPECSLRRYDLLRTLHERGTNRFNVFRATESGRPWRFPVFIRRESEHNGSLTPLINDQATLDQFLARFIMADLDPHDALIVEFCDTQDHGLFRKFSAFRIGDRIVPRHVLFSHDWVVKDLDLIEPEYREEIRLYCRDNPHETCGIFGSRRRRRRRWTWRDGRRRLRRSYPMTRTVVRVPGL
jgi:hypothetical protein